MVFKGKYDLEREILRVQEIKMRFRMWCGNRQEGLRYGIEVQFLEVS